MFCAADVHAGAHQAARDALHRRAGMSRTPKFSIQLETTLTNLAATALTQTNSHVGLAPSGVEGALCVVHTHTSQTPARRAVRTIQFARITFFSLNISNASTGGI